MRDDPTDPPTPVAPPTSAGAPWAAFPGPAVVLSRQGRLLEANDAAQGVAAAFAARTELAALTARVAEGGAGTTAVFGLTVGEDVVFVDATLVPLDDGRVLALLRDVTMECNLRAALIESRRRYKDLVEISSDFAWEVGRDGCFVFVSPKGALGYAAAQLVGCDPVDLRVPGAESPQHSPFRTLARVEGAMVWMRRADGTPACLATGATPILGDDGAWLGARGLCRDVTAEQAAAEALRRAKHRERLLTGIVRTIRDVVDPVETLAAAARVLARSLNAIGCTLLRATTTGGFAVATAAGTVGETGAAMASLAGHDTAEGAAAGRAMLAAVTRYGAAINGAVCLWRDAAGPAWTDDDRLLLGDAADQVGIALEQVAQHERIVALSRTDALTGLYNRRAFLDELPRRFARLRHQHGAAAVLFVDLDNFKLVNDTFGHHIGDEALLAVRDLLMAHTRPADLVARLGGDEFAVWLEGVDATTAEGRGTSLLASSAVLARFSGRTDAPLGLSIGVAVATPDIDETLDGLLARADKAMYAVKRTGKGAVRMATDQGGDAPWP